MIEIISGLCAGFISGVFFFAWCITELSKKKDWMMIDGKMKWVERTERFKKELEQLKINRIKELRK